MSESNNFLVELAKNNPIIAVFIGLGIAAFAYMEVAKSMASDVKTKVNTPTVSVNNTINNNIDVSKPKPETLGVKPETIRIHVQSPEITKIKQETVYIDRTTPNISTNPRIVASTFKELHTSFKLTEKEAEYEELATKIRFLCNEASDISQDAKIAMIYPTGEREAFELKRSEQHLFSFKNVKYRLYAVKILDGHKLNNGGKDVVELRLDSVE